MFFAGTIAFIYFVCYRIYQYFFPPPNLDPKGKYVLISGCDTGFGHTLAIELDKQGFYVLAGVYLSDNVIILRNKLSSKATVFELDITKQEDIDVAYELVQKKTNTLHALVNNAEITAGSYIDWTSLELMRQVLDVNFFGHVAMTKRFLPLLIAKRGSRVINTSSINGFMSMPATAAYSASKYALESFSDCLRREMSPWGLHVSIIEPGAMRTPIIENLDDQLRKLWSQLSSDVQERWGMNFLNNSILQMASSPILINAEDPAKVVRAMEHAILNQNPRIRYHPGVQARIFYLIYKLLPFWLHDQIFIKTSKLVPDSVRHQLVD